MGVKLSKGKSLTLSKDNDSLSEVSVRLGWDEKSFFQKLLTFNFNDFDLDASVYMLKDGKLKSQKDVVFYNNLKHSSGSVKHLGDDLTGAGKGDCETINIKLDKIPKEFNELVITVTIYRAKERYQSFKEVRNAYIRILDMKGEKEILRYDLAEQPDCYSMIFGKLVRDNNDCWTFHAVGEGYHYDGVGEMSRHFDYSGSF